MSGTHRMGAAVASMLSVVTLAACAGSASTTPTPSSPQATATASSTAGKAALPTQTIEVSAEAAELEHIHTLGLTGDTLLIGSHQGLFRQPPGEPPRRVGEPFDVMGFTIDGDRWLASGHPGPGMDAPPDLGLLQSDDEGTSWSDVSLSGQVDFHRLTAGGTVVLGVNSGDGLLWRSTDGGKNWDTAGPGPYDIAVNPGNPQQVVGTTQDGPMVSSDAGKRWEPIAGAPLIALLAWSDARVWGITPDGVVYSSTDSGETWREGGTVNGEPSALAANRTRITVLAEDTIWESVDQGATFAPRVTGIPGH